MHDSDLLSVETTADDIRVRMRAYIHRSPEQSGGKGTGWIQEVEVALQDGVILATIPELPSWLDTGSIKGSAEQHNLIPLPCEIVDDLQFELISLAQERLVVRATALKIQRLGEPKFVEQTPADFYS
ncbi:hypothetical protein NA78x_006251 [Anatilimnocola sp. NA78]|uniref:hypothetical protein n=1 Tax=Anatilimnocola sp. NA78 TaxID=3415683 RepID=UPI003CE53E7A